MRMLGTMLPQRRLVSSVALIAALAAPLAAFAEQAPPPIGGSPAPERHFRSPFMRVLHTLDLSPSQWQQIEDAVAQTRLANRNADESIRRLNRERLHAQIEAILTPEQRAQFQAELQKQRQQSQRPG
jgi:Spy/CpxP family protein refolding chaperone